MASSTISLSLVSASSLSVTSDSATPTATASAPSNSDPNPTANGSLYLFTFLTTLLLLLSVSFGIVLRSYIIRRRFRRSVEAAIAAGVLLPGALGGGGGGAGPAGGRAGQEKPRLWEVWMDEEKGGDEKGWEDIMPISAQVLSSSQSTTPPPQTPQPHTFRRTLLRTLLPPSLRRPPPPAPPISPAPSHPSSNPYEPTTPESLQITVLIAMPSASRPRPSSVYSIDNLKGKAKAVGAEEDEDELPEVCFGTTEVMWKGGAASPSEAP